MENSTPWPPALSDLLMLLMASSSGSGLPAWRGAATWLTGLLATLPAGAAARTAAPASRSAGEGAGAGADEGETERMSMKILLGELPLKGKKPYRREPA